MSDTVLRQRLIRVASQLPQGSAERRQVLALLREAAPERSEYFGKTTKLPFIDVQGFAGFTDQVRELERLSTQATALAAQIDAAVAPLITEKSKLDKEIKKVQDELKKEYKANLEEIGNITIVRKTALVDAYAMVQVVSKDPTLDEVQAKLISAIVEKYGQEVADFITKTADSLKETNQKLAVSFKGFELEHRNKTASIHNAGILDALVKFRTYLKAQAGKLIDFVKAALGMVESASARVDKTHAALVKAVKAVH